MAGPGDFTQIPGFVPNCRELRGGCGRRQMHKRTVLLSAWYLPMRVLGWQDAVKLVYLANVDVLVEYDEEIRSPSTTWKMPAVVRLRRVVPNRALGVKFSRTSVYLHDQYTCQYCARKLPPEDLTFDHLIP